MSRLGLICVLLSLFAALSHADSYANEGSNPCYEEHGKPQRCVPDFVNAAFNRLVEATNTCGQTRPTNFCKQTYHSDMGGRSGTCDICDDRIPDKRHPASFLTDFNNPPPNETWWQSETMYEEVQHPNMVNLTLVLGKSFDITYVRLKFHSPRPESFAIYKRSSPDEEWVPWQYYSASCRATYGMPDQSPILPGAEDVATCTREFSDISPLTGANMVFSTLEGRPSAERFEESSVLQDWVSATQIKIVLNRLNTFGDEVFNDVSVLRSYYYAISDFAVGGRCKCNGHASECVKSTGGGVERLVCRCEHSTMGEDCEQCSPFYNDRPWKAATSLDANECKPCECNGLASRCYFDQEMFDSSGSGGHCIDCTGNTRGPHCEVCVENHWRRPNEQHCMPCNCDATGSETLQCDQEGQCPCKPGVTGQYCDRCTPGFYQFDAQGCKDCHCDEAGSHGNQPNCRSDTGDCACKANVEGKQCDLCKPGHFSLALDNQFGCTPCFCHGHSSVCDTAPDWFYHNVTSSFARGSDKWTATDGSRLLQVGHSEDNEVIVVSASSATVANAPIYFVAPDKMLGDQRASYNQKLTFSLTVKDEGARASVRDVIIEGANGQELSIPIFGQNNPVPANYEQVYSFRIHESNEFGWNPRLTALDFLSVLANVTAFKIRGTYTPYDEGQLREVFLGSATLEPEADEMEAMWVESCTCPEGFQGQFCQECAPGYRRELKHGGPFTRCIKCECHGHTEFCDAESGACTCEHNTAGDTCERCARGYYGNALAGTADDCMECPCPDKGRCVLHTDNDIICLDCPLGYSGRRCDACADGYYGQPKDDKPCTKCECSNNIDDNSVGNCDQVTGECKKCIHHTYGFHCEKCLPGFWGDALLEPKGDCEACNCYAPGTGKPSADYDTLECAQEDGQCPCLPHATGQRCDACEDGYYNIASGGGCESCNCDPLGSVNVSCDISSGQCQCKPGVTGKRCDQCRERHFGFGAKGCDGCDCEIIGSESLQCDVGNGQCQCRRNIEGRRCDRCIENMYDLQSGCRECEECYGLIQKRVNSFRKDLKQLEDVLKEIIENPVSVNDTDFDNKLEEVKQLVKDLQKTVNDNLASDDSDLVSEIDSLRSDLAEALALIKSVDSIIMEASTTADKTDELVRQWEPVREAAYRDLDRARDFLETEGRDAWEAAREASEQYGEQSERLSEIAKEARALADEHEEKSEEIEDMAHQALNTSKKALAAVDEAIYGGEQTSEEIARLNAEYTAADDLYNQTKQMAEEQGELASKANTEAAEILTKVDALELPEVDTDELSARSKEIIEEAEIAKENALQQKEDNEALVDAGRAAVTHGHNALQQARGAQQQADDLLADVDVARNKARSAVQLADDTLKEANDTLYTLKEFDRLVEESKQRAIEELGQIPEIEKLIAEAENKTKEAEMALGNAKNDAASAEKIALQAQDDAEEASQAATDIREQAEQTKQDAQEVKDEVDVLKNDIEQARKTLGNYKTQAEEDKAKAAEAVAEAAQAERSANRTNETVTEALDKVKRILDELKSLDDIDDNDLAELEKQLEEAKQALETADLEGTINSLKEKQNEQQRQVNGYKADIDKLQKEVENIEQIRDSLPDQCFNLVKLEETRR